MSDQVDFSGVESAWQDVVKSKGGDDYLIMSYEKGSETKLKVEAKGVGGFTSIEDQLRDGVVQFIVARFAINMHGSQIEKTCFMMYSEAGSLQPARRAVVVRHQQQLADAIKASVNIVATQSDELTEEAVMHRLREGTTHPHAKGAAAESKE